MGTIFRPLKNEGRGILFAWIYGQVCLWATFLFACVPMILADAKFPLVETTYLALCGAWLVLSGILFLARRGKASPKAAEPDLQGQRGEKGSPSGSKAATLLWCVFAAVVILQVFCVFYLKYEDGDDAYYVAITSYSKEVHTLYRNIPYTGAYTGLDFRHSLAPFPVWVAVLADVAGLSGATTAHVIMPIFILFMTYGLYFLLGEHLMGEEKKKSWTMPLFMSFAALLVTFGGYSIYSAENFLIVTIGPGGERGGKIIFTREPSGRRMVCKGSGIRKQQRPYDGRNRKNLRTSDNCKQSNGSRHSLQTCRKSKNGI